MEGREKSHAVKYKANTNAWNYDASCTPTSLPVWDFNFKRLFFSFFVQSVSTLVDPVDEASLYRWTRSPTSQPKS
jgi:hypothetical protein